MLKIKKEFKDTVIAFGNSGDPLGKRSQEELLDLAILAHSSGHDLLVNAFEELPSAKDLKKLKMDNSEKAVKTSKEKDQKALTDKSTNGATKETPGYAEGNSSKEQTTT